MLKVLISSKEIFLNPSRVILRYILKLAVSGLRKRVFSRNALLWIKSYLHDRQFQVVSKTSNSESLNINLGFPQGSDIRSFLGPGVFQLLYVDNLQVYIQNPLEQISDALKHLALIAKSISS